MTTLTLKRYEVSALLTAIKSLDGRPDVVKDADGKTVGIIVKPFDLPMKARYALAKTMRSITGEVADYEKAQRDLLAAAEADPAKLASVEREAREFMMGEVQIDVHTFHISDLKIETNQLPPMVIANLLPILDGEP